MRGTFEDVSRATGADLRLRGNGCVAADLDLDGDTDLYVTTAGYDVAPDGYDALLWNDGDGRFTEGAWRAGIRKPGWHAGVAVADVNGDGRLDVFVSGYTDVNAPIPGSESGFPANHSPSATCSTSTSATTAGIRSSARSVAQPGSSRAASTTVSARRSPTSTATAASTSTSPTTSTRTGST